MLKQNGVLVFCFLSVSVVFSENSSSETRNAPFGLTWGMTETQVTQLLGVEIQKRVDSDLPLGITGILRVTSLPKNLTIAEFYSLIFVTERHLQKIVMYSEDIENDIYGSEGKEKYENIKTSLRKKYGPPTHKLEVSGLKLWNEPDEFYQCLDYDGCGHYFSIFKDEKSGMGIFLELKGVRRGQGFVKLTYEGPDWSAFIEAREKIES